MKALLKYSLLLIILSLLFQSCAEEQKEDTTKKFHSKDFNWTIAIPEGFDSVSAKEWAKKQNAGAEAIQQTHGETVTNSTTTLFVFQKDMNYFEALYQPFDTLTDGDHLTNCIATNEIVYETFKAQMPDLKLDSSRTIEKIDGLEFHKFNLKMTYPNNMTLNIISYIRLFDKKEFTVNIMYMDEDKGKKMLESWKNSKFEK